MAKVGIDPNKEYENVTVNEKEQGNVKLIDTRLMAGPLAERGCTDIFFLLLFIANLVFLFYIAGTGYANGQPKRLIAVYDSDKKACGIDYPGYNYLYWAFPYTGTWNRTTCVSSCPNQFNQSGLWQLQCQPNSVVNSCKINCGFLTQLSAGNVSLPPDPNIFNTSTFTCLYNTTAYFNRICAPTQIVDVLNQTSSFNSILSMDLLSTWVQDLQTTQYPIYYAFIIAFGLGIIYLLLTRIFAGVLVWLSVLAYFVAIAILTYLCWTKFQFYNQIVDSSKNSTISANSTNGTVNTNFALALNGSTNIATPQKQYTLQEIQQAQNNSITFQIITYIMLAVCVASLIGFACLFNKLRLAIAVIKTAAVFLKDEFLIILLPPVTSIFVVILWIWWLLTAIYVYAQGNIVGNGQTPFASVTLTQFQKQELWYFLFGGLWINALLQAINDFIIASACCIWYFSQGSGQGAHRAISTSIVRAFRYHLGSLAFGALILAIVQLIRIILEYVKLQMQKVAGKDNKVIKCLLNCLSCVMACFERCIRFLNRQAYIQIALTGKSFCPAAKTAFETVWANAARYSLVGGIGGAFIFVGKAFISVSTTVAFYFMITRVSQWSTKLFSPILPCIIVFFGAYAMGVLFMSIYGMACDTILACFIYDEDLNKQNGGQSAQHCPETLREFFEMPMIAQKMKEAQEKEK